MKLDLRSLLRAVAGWVALAFRASASLTMLATSISVVQAILPVLASWAVAIAISTVLISGADLSALSMCVVLILLSAAIARIGPIVSESLQDAVERQVRLELSIQMEARTSLSTFFSAKALDNLRLLDRDAYRLSGIHQLILGISALASVTVAVIALATVDARLAWLVPLAVLPCLAAAIADFRAGQIWLGNEAFRRDADSATDILNDPRHALEVRAFGLLLPLLKVVSRSQDRQAILMLRSRHRHGAAELVGVVALSFAMLAVTLPLATSAMSASNRTSAASLVLLVIPQVFLATRSLAASLMGVIDGANTFLRMLWIRDTNTERSEGSPELGPPSSLVEELVLSGVTYTYPGSSSPALLDVSLRLPAGATVCLVGENGSGKSTLVNILAGLIAPSTGTVEVDGTRLEEFDRRSWQRHVTAGFQQGARFEIPIEDSISGGKLASAHRLESALKASLLTDIVHSLPNGKDTVLGHRFRGAINLSGGQWQRVALARAIYKEGAIVSLLDEPTSALDPETEVQIYTNFGRIARATGETAGAITVFVSHRLSTARQADLVVVLDRGRVAGVGKHEELLACLPHYRLLFDRQAAPYADDPGSQHG
ncbi:ABC transporter ATP-binding protein [Microbacterium azadirachtae]|nr:ABC transporter ATP-binding protein [Microbacterium azadirachtae]